MNLNALLRLQLVTASRSEEILEHMVHRGRKFLAHLKARKRRAAKKQNLLAKYIKFFIIFLCLYPKKPQQRTKNIIVRDGFVFLRAQTS